MECPDLELLDRNNACSSNVLKYFSPAQLAKASSASSGLDNQHFESVVSSDVVNVRNSGCCPVTNYSRQQCSSSPSTTYAHFTPFFLAVEEELLTEVVQCDDHEKQLLVEYKIKEMENMPVEGNVQNVNTKTKGVVSKKKHVVVPQAVSDNYEKVVPKHGDVFLHKMSTILSRNPGQVIR